MRLIIGGGLAGLSCAYHLGSESIILEQKSRVYGHASSHASNGFTWDEGPHVSFTQNEYVKKLFAQSVDEGFEEFPVLVSNYYKGHWIDHPAQTALYQVPEPLRTQCLTSFLESRRFSTQHKPANYAEWLISAFGEKFAKTFPFAYTRKYWTVEPDKMSTNWLGSRVLNPDTQLVIDGAHGPLRESQHYIKNVRYPQKGGYQSFAKKIAQSANIQYGERVVRINLHKKELLLSNGKVMRYESLINTMPLPEFIMACEGVPRAVLDAACALSCTQLLLVNVGVKSESLRPEHWLYVYDEDLMSTRLNFTEKLSKNNAPDKGWTGVQTEVYFSRFKPLLHPPKDVGQVVLDELIKMNVLGSDARSLIERGDGFIETKYSPWANIIYLHDTGSALEEIWRWLERFGLVREENDTEPLADWGGLSQYKNHKSKGSLRMAGRFAQWKYFWSDDCILRGLQLGMEAGGVFDELPI